MSGLDEHIAAIAELAKAKPAKKKAPYSQAPATTDPEEDAEEAEEEEEEAEEAEQTASGKNKTTKCGCGKSLKAGESCTKCSPAMKSVVFIPIAKASDEEQTVTGVVLQPEVTDGQGDIYDANVIKLAAYDFLANYNRQTELGLQHKEFKKGRFALVESYLLPMDCTIGNRVTKAGSWIMTVKVLDSKIWAAVKAGKITGFSIGGKAQVQQLKK